MLGSSSVLGILGGFFSRFWPNPRVFWADFGMSSCLFLSFLVISSSVLEVYVSLDDSFVRWCVGF